jgi:hypothetical protein
MSKFQISKFFSPNGSDDEFFSQMDWFPCANTMEVMLMFGMDLVDC